jgi:Na+/H+ antiporter NhaC
MDTENGISRKPNGLALLPLLVFIALYVITFIITRDLKNMPISVAFLTASVVALFTSKGGKIKDRVAIFCRGAGDETILLMIFIFILAGAFASTAQKMGAVDATVNMLLYLLPQKTIMVTTFIAACFISMSMGTSTGTIAALTPIAVGISAQTGIPLPAMLGVVIGGSMFGDNLSFISDTTIVATRTQGCEMKDKFKVNIRIVFPAVILIAILYIYQGFEYMDKAEIPLKEIEWLKVIPYLVVLILAMAGVNVIRVLIIGIVLSGVIGLISGGLSIWQWTASMSEGIVVNMGELIIVSLMAGGMFGIIRYNGGIEWLTKKITSKIKTKRSAELAIAGLVSITNACTANNTIALIINGPIAKHISDRFNLNGKKVASIMDTFSCFVQGLLPYGAQLLIAAGIAKINPIEIVPYLYYCMLLGVMAFLAILFRYPKKYS